MFRTTWIYKDGVLKNEPCFLGTHLFIHITPLKNIITDDCVRILNFLHSVLITTTGTIFIISIIN